VLPETPFCGLFKEGKENGRDNAGEGHDVVPVQSFVIENRCRDDGKHR
jgi:hypothetical protein